MVRKLEVNTVMMGTHPMQTNATAHALAMSMAGAEQAEAVQLLLRELKSVETGTLQQEKHAMIKI